MFFGILYLIRILLFKQFTKTLWLKSNTLRRKKINPFVHIVKRFIRKDVQSKSIVKCIGVNVFHVDIVFNLLKKLNFKPVQFVLDFQVKMNYYMMPNVINIIVCFNF